MILADCRLELNAQAEHELCATRRRPQLSDVQQLAIAVLTM